ncbi:hypothetical protein Ciccas_001355 [Cichlidogyrus casuarinus]|uniref:Uncharacterized protein n=1 Tax=Cichlidogyrus casuarinus TaxID=1844966 RepID=A0ABD2QLG0_9PLAT
MDLIVFIAILMGALSVLVIYLFKRSFSDSKNAIPVSDLLDDVKKVKTKESKPKSKSSNKQSSKPIPDQILKKPPSKSAEEQKPKPQKNVKSATPKPAKEAKFPSSEIDPFLMEFDDSDEQVTSEWIPVESKKKSKPLKSNASVESDPSSKPVNVIEIKSATVQKKMPVKNQDLPLSAKTAPIVTTQQTQLLSISDVTLHFPLSN